MKYRFASPSWLAAVHGTISERAAAMISAGDHPTFSMCEVFYGAPEGIANDGDRVVWSCVVDGATIDFRTEERDDVQLKVVADYATCEPLASYDTEGKPERQAEFARLMSEGREAGKVDVVYQPGGVGSLGSVHDAAARFTL